jgi:hypothetical protein
MWLLQVCVIQQWSFSDPALQQRQKKESQYTNQVDKHVIRSANWKKVHKFFFMNKLPTIKEVLPTVGPDRD